MQLQLLLDSEEPLKPHKQNVQEVTLALTSVPAYLQQQSPGQTCCYSLRSQMIAIV